MDLTPLLILNRQINSGRGNVNMPQLLLDVIERNAATQGMRGIAVAELMHRQLDAGLCLPLPGNMQQPPPRQRLDHPPLPTAKQIVTARMDIQPIGNFITGNKKATRARQAGVTVRYP